MEKHLYSPKQKALLKLLRQVRTDGALRQEDVADKLSKPQSFVSKYESGERRLDILELIEVCGALNIRPIEFVRRLERALART